MARDYIAPPSHLIQMFKWSIKTYFKNHEDAVLNGFAVQSAAWRALRELQQEGAVVVEHEDDDDDDNDNDNKD